MVLTSDEAAAAARKQKEAADFGSRMDTKYDRPNETQRAMDEYDRRYGNPRPQLPNGGKHLQSNTERLKQGLHTTGSYAAKAAKATGSGLRAAAQKTSAYVKKRRAERAAYHATPEYAQKQEQKRSARDQRKKDWQVRMRQQKANGGGSFGGGNAGFDLFGGGPGPARRPQQRRRQPRQMFNGGIFATPRPQRGRKGRKTAKAGQVFDDFFAPAQKGKRKGPGMGGIVGDWPSIF